MPDVAEADRLFDQGSERRYGQGRLQTLMFELAPVHVTVPVGQFSVVPAACMLSITRQLAPGSQVTTQPPLVPSSPTQSTTQLEFASHLTVYAPSASLFVP